MSFSAETPPPVSEVAITFRDDLWNVVRLHAEAAKVERNPDLPTLPAQIFLGGQLETETNLFTNAAIIRATVGPGRTTVTQLTYGEDKYMIIPTKIYNVNNPEVDLSCEELEDLTTKFKNPAIDWNPGQSNSVFLGFLKNKAPILVLSGEITLEDILL